MTSFRVVHGSMLLVDINGKDIVSNFIFSIFISGDSKQECRELMQGVHGAITLYGYLLDPGANLTKLYFFTNEEFFCFLLIS